MVFAIGIDLANMAAGLAFLEVGQIWVYPTALLNNGITFPF